MATRDGIVIRLDRFAAHAKFSSVRFEIAPAPGRAGVCLASC